MSGLKSEKLINKIRLEMKKQIILLTNLFLFLGLFAINAQDAQQQCNIKYNLFKGDYQSKKYEDAYPNWMHLMDNCQKLSINVYKLGDKLAQVRFKNAENKTEAAALVKRVYLQRLENFPNIDPAKAHSNYATFLIKNKLASNQEVFEILQLAYSIDPTRMSVRNIYRYFQGITDTYKDTNPQKVFDTYDDVLESVGEKLADYAKKLKALNDKTEAGQDLDKIETKNLRAYTINSKALGQVESGLDKIIIVLSTCDRLIPLYERDFEENKTNSKWLRRAVSRMFNKECTDDPLFEKLAIAYADASPSADAYSFVAGVLAKKGDNSGAQEMRLKAFDLETDPLKKANFKLKFAQAAKKRGQKSKARQLAREAIALNPNMGRAYLFIASLYASSVNACGTNEFEKRMTYVAAYNKAVRASNVDPSISTVARKFTRNYKANFPSKKVIFTEGVNEGTPFKVKCWINESVKITSSGK
jgi:tetratricopeptide (TPR) repeat protein